MKSLHLLAVLLLAHLVPAALSAPAEQAFTYQGSLAGANGSVTGTYDMTFKLFDALTSGTPVGSGISRTAVPVTNGLFTVTLDFGAAAFDGNARWLEIAVSSQTLSPRTPITPTPYAIMALKGPPNTTALTSAGANAYFTGGNLGIGTSDPKRTLHVGGTTRIGDATEGGAGTDGNFIQFELEPPAKSVLRFDTAAFTFWNPNGGEVMRLMKGGLVGIGTANPVAPLTVRGSATPVRQSFVTSDGPNSTFRIAHPSLNVTALGADRGQMLELGGFDSTGAQFDPFLTLNQQRVGVGTTNPDSPLHVLGWASPVHQSFVTSDGVNSTFRIAHPEPNVAALGANKGHALRLGGFDGAGGDFKPYLELLQIDGTPYLRGVAVYPPLSAGLAPYVDTAPIHLGDPIRRWILGTNVVVHGSMHVDGKLNVAGDMNVDGKLTYKSISAVTSVQSLEVSSGGATWQVLPGKRPWQDGFFSTSTTLDIPGTAGDLYVWDNLHVTDNLFVDADAHVRDAYVRSLEITGGGDIAEPFNVSGKHSAKPGTVVSIDSANPGGLRVATTAYDHAVAGVISGAGGINPGMMLSQKNTPATGDHPVALTGRVYCYADADAGGPITPGDFLTTSDTPGHAMRAADRERAAGATIGKAMSPLEHGQGLVLILVNLQ